MKLDRITSSQNIGVGIVFSIPLFSSFAFFFNTPDNIWNPKFFALLYLSILSFLIFALFFKSKIIKFSLDNSSWFLILYAIYGAIRNLFEPFPFADNHALLSLLIIIPLYLSYKYIFSVSKLAIAQLILTIAFLIIGLLQSSMGLLQYFNFIPNLNSYFELGGTFGNPNILATFLAPYIPITLGLILCRQEFIKGNRSILWLCAVLSVLCTSTVLISQSRSAWLGALAGLGILLMTILPHDLIQKLRRPLTKFFCIGIMTALLVIIIYFLYLKKPTSADGRLLIWKISKDLVIDNPVFGVGYGRFEPEYAKCQTLYFKEHPNDTEAIMLAGEVRVAYNGYLHILSESGIIGLFLFLGFIFFSVKDLLKSIKYNRLHSRLAYLTFAGCTVILVNSIFSFTLYVVPVLLNFMFLMAIVNSSSPSLREQKKGNRLTRILFMIFMAMLFFIGVKKTKSLQSEFEIKKIQRMLTSKRSARARRRCIELSQYLGYNREFNMVYGKALYLNKLYKEAVERLELSLLKFSDVKIHMMIGDCYWRLGEFEKAEKAYENAVHLVPSKFKPRYALVKLYERRGKVDEVVKLAKETMDMQVKVPSTEVDDIKEKLAKLIDTYTQLIEFRDNKMNNQ